LPVGHGPAKSSDAMAKIQFTTPEGTTGEVELTAERMPLGRADDNLIVIAHDSVSSHHGELAIEGDSWVFTDLGSTNGSKVSGQPAERFEVGHGSTFTIGHVDCVFIGDYEEAPAYSAPTRTMTTGGYGDTAIDRSRRAGFGPKAKPKGNGSGPLIGLGVLALLVCAYAVFSFSQLTA